MHHHSLPNNGGAGNQVADSQQQQQQQRRRKKRSTNFGTRVVEVKRGYNLDFGFIISGQQPCRLSCIVANSPAEKAGLRPGDFLISVNGLNVSKLPHETVVQLIGNSFGSIRMQIAENYFSDSSDEENAAAAALLRTGGSGSPLRLNSSMTGVRTRPRYLHHKAKMHRLRNSPQKKRQQPLIRLSHDSCQPPAIPSVLEPPATLLRPLLEDLPIPSRIVPPTTPSTSAEAATSGAATLPSSNVSADVANVSAMVRVVPSVALEYRAVVGYLGTIEMPKQISQSSKLQTVRFCIRKLRQEKRQPMTVLMTILPDCLRLQSSNGNVLATYTSSRLNYVSSSSESENRFFGLVTSAVHTSQADDDDGDGDEIRDDDAGNIDSTVKASNIISISNSCHVFVIDTKLCDHQTHLPRAAEFRLKCTHDPISNLCLEFPRHAEYVVNLIRSMYTMRILPPATRNTTAGDDVPGGGIGQQGAAAAAHSPQPSNHSEISTTTSNSDSGIGFHNDCANISDRILVVDFPGDTERNRIPLPPSSMSNSRPLGIFNNFDAIFDNRLTVRAMPDPKTNSNPLSSQLHSGRPDLLANFDFIKSPGGACSLTATRSCDDVLNLVERTPIRHNTNDMFPSASHASMDDLALADTIERHNEEIPFLPSNDVAAPQKGLGNSEAYGLLQDYRFRAPRSLQAPPTSMPHKLSPQVFINAKCQMSTTTPTKSPPSGYSLNLNCGLSLSTEDLNRSSHQYKNEVSTSKLFDFEVDTWSSLQNLHARVKQEYRSQTLCDLEATNSEPDLGNRALPSNASPFRRAWGQSSFRTPRTDKHIHNHSPIKSNPTQNNNSPLVRRAASMTASDNDVYIKSMNGYIDEHKHPQQIQKIRNNNITTKVKNNNNNGAGAGAVVNFKTPAKISNNKVAIIEDPSTGSGVSAWGNSFERLLEDAAGLHTFAEFLKKEFSAENIYFWTACERYRQAENRNDRVEQARIIFNKHLANGSLEPVNVDSQARNLSEEQLQNGELDIFIPAQKQIFNLMKFDSYQRFIRSDLYKSCQEAEEKQQALPYSAENLDELLRLNIHKQTAGASSASKLKKSASNAEDRRRKSLLPWHRKTRSKSRDRCEAETVKTAATSNGTSNTQHSQQHAPSKLPLLTTSSSLKIPSSHNSLSDIHSSRSSLSSFDAVTANIVPPAAEVSYSLCRVILSDGATTIVQTRAEETVAQLVERLLEKRGLSYKHYDVITTAISGSSKSIDLQSNALATLAGKEVHIEQRVAFKLDLPDPKVISVKSKPKKVLHEVIRPILHKYNYEMDAVQVFVRETQSLLDLSLPVTVVDGQRLQIVLLRQSAVEARASALANLDYQNSTGKFMKTVPLSKSNSVATMVATTTLFNKHNCISSRNGMAQSTLDEITNKVFNELLQGKVEAHASYEKPQMQHQQSQLAKLSDLCSIKSDESESSSLFERSRRRDSNNIPAPRTRTKKKSISSQNSEEAQNIQNTPGLLSSSTVSSTTADVKKPIIAKLKAGVKLQVTERVNENQDELLEGLKRAQLARLEDQRGTEINIELPEFLRHKENISAAASKLRKVRANLSPLSSTKSPDSPTTAITTYTSPFSMPNTNKLHTSPSKSSELTLTRPQPAPRLSITNRQKANSISPMKIDEEDATAEALTEIDTGAGFETALNTEQSNIELSKGPPPLPPKPKVLPIKPSNWGANANATACSNSFSISTGTSSNNNSKIPIDISRKLTASSEQISAIPKGLGLTTNAARCAYLEEPTSSFV